MYAAAAHAEPCSRSVRYEVHIATADDRAVPPRIGWVVRKVKDCGATEVLLHNVQV